MDLPINSMVDLSHQFLVNVYQAGYLLVISHMAVENHTLW